MTFTFTAYMHGAKAKVDVFAKPRGSSRPLGRCCGQLVMTAKEWKRIQPKLKRSGIICDTD